MIGGTTMKGNEKNNSISIAETKSTAVAQQPHWYGEDEALSIWFNIWDKQKYRHWKLCETVYHMHGISANTAMWEDNTIWGLLMY